MRFTRSRVLLQSFQSNDSAPEYDSSNAIATGSTWSRTPYSTGGGDAGQGDVRFIHSAQIDYFISYRAFDVNITLSVHL